MVTAVKRDGEVGLAYMKSFEREERIRRQGEEEGKKEGLEEGIIKLSRKLGKEDTEILSFLISLDMLQKLHQCLHTNQLILLPCSCTGLAEAAIQLWCLSVTRKCQRRELTG